MNVLNSNTKQHGVGLIEILIVLVVLVIGWAAIAALQGKLMSGTSVSKARNEALELAREKTEELRNSIEMGQYSAVMGAGLVNDSANPIGGVNATFERSWFITDVTLDNPAPVPDVAVDTVKQLVMTVTWDNNAGVSESVTLNSMIGYSDAIKMVSLVTGGSGVAGEVTANVLSAIEGPGKGVSIVDTALSDEGDPSDPADDLFTGKDDFGNLVVYQGQSALPSFVELTVFGGKILKFTGNIYYDSSDPYVRATSPSFCATFVQDGYSACGLAAPASGFKCARYVCYASGDCSNGGDGCVGDLTKLPDLNGGWFGKIGDFFPDLANAQSFPTICMGDLNNKAARFYASERVNPGSNTGFAFEGINTSFECSDTLISKPNDSGCSTLVGKLKTAGINVDPNAVPEEIADSRVIRPLAVGDTNDVLAASTYNNPNGVFANFCPPPPTP